MYEEIEKRWQGINSLLTSVNCCHVSQNEKKESSSSLSILRRVLRARMKIGITRIADITDLDYVGIPVACAYRPNVSDAQISATQGKGLTKLSSIISAGMEAVERYSASSYSNTITANYKELSQNRWDFVLPEELGADKIGENRIDWLKAKKLRDNKCTYVPAAEVLFPYYPADSVVRPMRPSTTGLAAGSTKIEAVISSIFEVVERDTISRYLDIGQGKILDLNSVRSRPELTLIELFYKANIDLLVLDFSHLSPLPVFFASILGKEGPGPHLLVAGQGAHLSPNLALRRALLEAAQSRLVAIQGGREDLIRHLSDWEGSDKDLFVMHESLSRNSQQQGISNMCENQINLENLLEVLYQSLAQLERTGYQDVFVTDLTNPAIGIPVVHSIIPGMVDTVVEPMRQRVVL